VRFATMAEGFVRDTVRAWPALLSAGGQVVVDTSLAPVVGGVQPSPRLGFGPRRIYLLGGSNDEGALSTVLAYDPALDSWCEVASMAMKRCRHVAAALGGKLYVMGGYDVGEEMPLAEVEVFDPKANGWQPVPSMPTARRAFAAAAVAGKVYAIGGLDDNSELCDAVEAYDPLFGAWTQVASLPVARGYHTTAVVDGKMYVLGGEFIDDEGYQVATDRVDVYDPAANSWQQMAAMPTARHGHAAAVMDGKIYVSGGFTSRDDSLDAFEAYDPVTNTWATLASLSEARADHASAAAHGKLYVFGGWASGDGLDLVEVYSPASNSWARAADLTSAIDEVVAVAL
jgi:N-acetylneuraminic acid mutarotase